MVFMVIMVLNTVNKMFNNGTTAQLTTSPPASPRHGQQHGQHSQQHSQQQGQQHRQHGQQHRQQHRQQHGQQHCQRNGQPHLLQVLHMVGHSSQLLRQRLLLLFLLRLSFLDIIQFVLQLHVFFLSFFFVFRRSWTI